MLTTPFLTDLDLRAAVKGSRDPLGIQQIWTRLGRHVVGNLTTVSNSLRDFTTLLLGYYFAAGLADELGPGTELATFLKWEQLAAYARATANKDWAFRGTDKVRKNLSESSRVTLSDDSTSQILGNQRIYGLWGLYSMPSRASGLIDGEQPRLTPPALEFVESLYLPLLEAGAGNDARRIRDALRARTARIDVQGSDAPMIKAVGTVLRQRLTTTEREFYRRYLLYGGPNDETGGRQQQLAELFQGTLGATDFAWSPAMVGSLAKNARAHGETWHPLADRLERIRTSETVLAPVSAFFTHLLGLDGKPIDFVAMRLGEAWGSLSRTVDPRAFGDLRGELATIDSAAADRWVAIANALADGDYRTLVGLVLDQNRAVMAARGGAPWIEARQDMLHVRFREEQGALPKRAGIPALWRFSYFLDSLRSIAGVLQAN